MISPSPPPPPPPRVSWERDLLGLIRACSSSPPLLKQIHSHLLRRHLLRRHPRLSLALLRSLPRSLSLLSLLPPHRLSLPFSLRSAAAASAAAAADALHAAALLRALDLDPFVRTSLAHAYLSLHLPRLALQLFDETPLWHRASNPLLWNVSLSALSHLGDLPAARALFRAMPCRTLASWNTLLHALLHHGRVAAAAHLFDRMPRRNVVSWTTAVAGYSRNGDNERAVRAFEAMIASGVRPNEFALAAALSACARMGALEIGIRIHNYVRDNNFSADGAVGTALVDMYAKCGRIDCAGRVFDGMSQRDVLTWTAMIMGWAVHGHWQKALQCFEDMKCSCIEPDEGVFLAVLMACAHSGKVEKGLEIFDTMTQEYRIEPTVKHYTCMVDLFGRAGRLEEALDFIKSMPVEPDFVVWGALFTACRAHKNVEMSEFASNKLLELKPSHHGSYIFLSNMYAGAGRWEDVEKVRVSMKDRGVEKAPGWSCIELEGKAHNFVAGDRSHPRSKDIYCKLEELEVKAREKGYEPNTEWVLHNIEEEDKEDSLGCHSEKLALALGLLSAPKGEVVIRIVKNLRVCGDCHSLMKFASELYGREIVLRDLKRFHHFQDGQCSCGDYW
ncbi:Pentatricopeptide repeat-containing protein [Ananas comosus]|uniref:Pentatricopeptide repeat-containing protein n=1 Tax=Ananas comosus TaxID=4615 RepID=A0A199VUR4_ANACO|nr:Pentatricopeptide repeat-containing protein [Ananas comosus]